MRNRASRNSSTFQIIAWRRWIAAAMLLSLSIPAAAAPTLTISANPPSVTSGSPSTLTWSSTEATSCAASGAWSGVKAASGSQSVTAPNGLSTYALSCSGPAGRARNSVVIGAGATPPALYALNVTVNGSGTVTSNPSGIACGATCSASYPSGAVVTLSAVAAAGYTFSGWSGACTGTGACTTTLSAARSVTATFTATGSGGGSILAVAAAWAAEPVRTGTVHYFCDCGTGASGSCVAGNNSNAGTSASAPQQTIATAMSTLNSMPSGDTVALCQGGAFNAASGFNVTRSSCAAGTTCVDLREYSPATFVATAKPIINNPITGAGLFAFNGNRGGVRFLNLTLNGNNGTIGDNNDGFFFYNGAHDVTLGNLAMNNFDTAVYNAGGNPGVVRTSNIKLTGNRITNSRTFGFLGAGINADISYNYWDGNGSSTVFDHTLYLSAAQHVTNMSVVGNYIFGQYGPTCLGAPIVAHVAVDGLLVANNTVEITAAATTAGCWGMAFNNVTGDTDAVYHRNATFSGNTVINGGNTGFTITNCPDCIIENNLIVNNWPYVYEIIGMNIPSQAAKLANGDDLNTRNIVRNNTVWFGPNTTNGGVGIRVGTEGTGYIIANNTVYYGASSGGSQGVDCFDYSLALTAYAFINNNHCYSAAAYEWVSGRGTLAAWRTVSGFDSASIAGVDPMFTATGTNFAPAAGSPLIGAGNNTHKSTLDLLGVTRPNPPAIGAYEPLWCPLRVFR